MNKVSEERASPAGEQSEHRSLWESLRILFLPSSTDSDQQQEQKLLGKLTPQLRARLLYEYSLASEKKVSESVHNLFIIAEHYSAENSNELDQPEVINGIPAIFKALTPKQKADYCYNQVTDALSLEAMPVTAESLRATKRMTPNNPWSSYAGAFVRRVTWYVILPFSPCWDCMFSIPILWNCYAWIQGEFIQRSNGLLSAVSAR